MGKPLTIEALRDMLNTVLADNPAAATERIYAPFFQVTPYHYVDDFGWNGSNWELGFTSETEEGALL